MEKYNKLFYVLAGVLIIVVIIVANSGSKSGIVNSSIDEFNENVNDDVVLIDVRTKEEYDEGHLDGAINIDYTLIEDEVNYDLDTKIAVYCQTGARSHAAALMLEQMGYKNIYDLGGIDNYTGELTTK